MFWIFWWLLFCCNRQYITSHMKQCLQQGHKISKSLDSDRCVCLLACCKCFNNSRKYVGWYLLVKSEVVYKVGGTTHKSLKFECHEETACSTVVCRLLSQAVHFVNQSAKQHCAVLCGHVCFFCSFFWHHVTAVLQLYWPAKMTDVKKKQISIKFCFRFCKWKHTKWLKQHLVIMP